MPPLRLALDRFFDDWFENGDLLSTEGGIFHPDIDVADQEKQIVVTAELPGLTEENIELQLDGRHLLIKGEKSEEKEKKDKDYFHRECRFGSFQREVYLPAEVIVEDAKAKCKNGVLKITMPKTEEARKKKRKISIE